MQSTLVNDGFYTMLKLFNNAKSTPSRINAQTNNEIILFLSNCTMIFDLIYTKKSHNHLHSCLVRMLRYTSCVMETTIIETLSVSVNCKKANNYVNIRTIMNIVFTLMKSKWLCCITLLPIFNKYRFCLFDNNLMLHSYTILHKW